MNLFFFFFFFPLHSFSFPLNVHPPLNFFFFLFLSLFPFLLSSTLSNSACRLNPLEKFFFPSRPARMDQSQVAGKRKRSSMYPMGVV